MIILNCPMKRDYITELLETYDKDGVTFKKNRRKRYETYF
ncbi:hypothetical protein G161_04830 [Listeria monocytogenes FSL F6-684]|nr:hypothetical protein G161_04830 [Listeria monocytogenes FSL F6-684]